jgi:hypothetical protein
MAHQRLGAAQMHVSFSAKADQRHDGEHVRFWGSGRRVYWPAIAAPHRVGSECLSLSVLILEIVTFVRW